MNNKNSVGNINKSYKTILESINSVNKEETYKNLISIESNVLNSINRIIEHEKNQELNDIPFYNQSIYEIVTKFVNVWKEILHDIFIKKEYIKTSNIFIMDDRKTYVGIAFILLGIILAMTFMS